MDILSNYDIPKTIEEFQLWYVDENLPSYEATRFYIAEDYEGAMAHGIYFNELTGGHLPELIPGIREVLAYLKSRGVQCWVVTGSGQRSLLDRLLTTFPDTFTGIISAFDVQHGKPHPEPYLKAWERCGFAKNECMVVENAPLGVRAGKAAELFTVAVNTGPLPDELLWNEKADVVVPNMAALLAWLQQLQ